MFGLILLGLALIGGLGGWFLGNRQRGWRLTLLWVLLPFWLCLPLAIPAAILGGVDGLLQWLMLVGMLGYPILAWAIPAAVVFAIARYGDKMAGNLRAP